MQVLKLIIGNALRHPLRTLLTTLGLLVAILSFGLLQTVVDAWYAGAARAAPNRLIVRNAVSLVVPLPIHYREKIRAVPGVRAVATSNWFAGVFKEPKNFFPQFAIDPIAYLGMYPEYLIKDDELREFLRDRQGVIIGRKLAQTHGLQVGDTMPLRGTIYPGNWEFVVRAIYDGVTPSTDTTLLFFQWQYLNDSLRIRAPLRANQAGVFVVQVEDAGRAAEIGLAIDQLFKNSPAETLTETEQAFQIGFVKQTESLVIAIRIVSYVVIFIILAVMANTMAMTARERRAEYATLKALGFGPGFLWQLILGESLALAIVGAGAGIALTFPVAQWFGAQMGTLFKSFVVSPETVWMQGICALVVGVLSAIIPAVQASRGRIVDGLRAVS